MRLDDASARAALCLPARREKVPFTDEAIRFVLSQSSGYPYFLQEWGKHSWNVADNSPIDGEDARRATDEALADLDASFSGHGQGARRAAGGFGGRVRGRGGLVGAGRAPRLAAGHVAAHASAAARDPDEIAVEFHWELVAIHVGPSGYCHHSANAQDLVGT